MRCLMDIRDDELRREEERFYQPRDPSTFRRMECDCDVDPVIPKKACGCLCPKCGSQCKECPGYGWVERPEPWYFKTIARALALIDRGFKSRLRPPDYIRMSEDEIRALVEKVEGEDADHPLSQIIDVGPPVRIYGTAIIVDKRRF